MRTIAILPIKSFGAAKQRLSSLLGSGLAPGARPGDVLGRAGGAAPRRGARRDRGGHRRRAAESAARGDGVALLDDPTRPASPRPPRIGIRHALGAGFDRVLLVPGDTPLLDPREVDALLAARHRPASTIVPDRHGDGTNALLLAPPERDRAELRPGQPRRHSAAARAAGVEPVVEHVPSLMLDVDTPDDLAELAARSRSAAATRRSRAAPCASSTARRVRAPVAARLTAHGRPARAGSPRSGPATTSPR